MARWYLEVPCHRIAGWEENKKDSGELGTSTNLSPWSSVLCTPVKIKRGKSIPSTSLGSLCCMESINSSFYSEDCNLKVFLSLKNKWTDKERYGVFWKLLLYPRFHRSSRHASLGEQGLWSGMFNYNVFPSEFLESLWSRFDVMASHSDDPKLIKV